jgi:phospholipid/cholesterol/gamma-HCH transport system substrate-binding protein
MTDSRLKLRLAGAGLVLVVLAAFGLTAAFYTHAFSNPLTITLHTSRTGLVMDTGNVVKMRGITIGRVSSIHANPDGTATLKLEIDRGQVGHIPADVTAQIRSSTVFGAKYVDLVPPAHPSGRIIAAGAVIENSGVTTEVNTVFKSLDGVLKSVDVTDLNVTLTSLSTALQGRGDTIAAIAQQADDYLTKLEPLLPQMRQDLYQVARFGDLGVRISPALLAILGNATVTSKTIVTQEQALDRLLVNLSLLGDTGTRLLGLNSRSLATLLHNLRPTTGTLAAYSSELPCLLEGLDKTRDIMQDVIGGTTSALIGRVSIRGDLPPYKAPKDLPGYPEGRGPSCAGMPHLAAGQVPYPERGTPQ